MSRLSVAAGDGGVRVRPQALLRTLRHTLAVRAETESPRAPLLLVPPARFPPRRQEGGRSLETRDTSAILRQFCFELLPNTAGGVEIARDKVRVSRETICLSSAYSCHSDFQFSIFLLVLLFDCVGKSSTFGRRYFWL